MPMAGVHAAGTVSTCNEASLDAALAGGGTVTFACSGTINLTSTKTISSDTTVDGFGQDVILDGGSARRLFSISANVALTLTHLTLQNGSTTADGGAIRMANGGTLTIQYSTISNNVAGDNSGDDYGGAIYADDASGATSVTVSIENSLFENNQVIDYGGVIYIDGGDSVPALLEISNSSFRNNQADPTADTARGGVIYASSHTTVNIEGSTFENNQAGDDGGVIVSTATSSIVNIANSTFSENSGGAANPSEALGGAMFIRDANMVQSTFYNNQIAATNVVSRGNAIYWNLQSGANVVMRDNVFDSNSGGAAYACESSGGSGAYGSNNLSDDGSCNTGGTGSAVTNFDTTLQDNGGPTDTHALNSGSNAIDTASACTYASTGTNNLFTDGANITRDQRGALRPYNSTCDKGAVERQAPEQNCTLSVGTDITVGGVTFNFSELDSLGCVTVEQMGTDHLMATGPGSGGGTLHTADW